MDPIIKELFDKIDSAIGIAITRSRMLLQPYSKVYPPNLVDATEKMLSEIYDNHQLNIDETTLSSAIDKYLKATRPY